jgi:DNA-binding HxlR family transcriptional regulator
MAKTGEKNQRNLEEMKKLLKPILKRILTERLRAVREQQPPK